MSLNGPGIRISVLRRASAVVLIYPIRRNRYEGIDPFLISDALMHDSHHLVLQGYGWMLKVLSQLRGIVFMTTC